VADHEAQVDAAIRTMLVRKHPTFFEGLVGMYKEEEWPKL
jgi:hypothetical protein